MFGQSFRKENEAKSPSKLKNGEEKVSYKMPEEYLWRVTETIPFIVRILLYEYTPPIVAKKKPRENLQEEELRRLTKAKNEMSSQRTASKKNNETEEILKLENRRLEQVEEETKKVEEQCKKVSLWRKIFCCLC